MKTEQLKKLLACCATILGVVAFVMLFMVAVTTGGDDPVTYKGQQLAFGADLASAKWGDTVLSAAKLNFSFPLVLAYFLPLVLAVLLAVGQFGLKSKGIKFIFGCVAFVGFIVAAILVAKTLTISTATYKGILTGETTGAIKDWNSSLKLGVGSIIAIVCNALAACVSGTYTCLNLLKK